MSSPLRVSHLLHLVSSKKFIDTDTSFQPAPVSANGAAGVIPSVLKYIVEFISDDPERDVKTVRWVRL